tara:strand:+ start:102 stop:1166 length:1065 start_codon:yes stop_codon:yes gene_type:complete
MSGGVYTTNLIKSLGALTDVDSDNRLDGQAPVYNLSKDIYEHKTVTTTTDAGITGAEGDVIICDGAGNIISTDKINITNTELTIDPIRTFDTLSLSQPYVIQYNDTTKEVIKNPDLHIRDAEMRDILASNNINCNQVFFSTNGNDTKIVNNSFDSISNYAFAKGLQVTGSGNLASFTCGVHREGSATNSYPQITTNRFLQLSANTYINYSVSTFDHNFYVSAGKSIRLNGTAIATAPSDDRIKFNETLITDGLDVINQINIYRYDKVYEIGDTPKEDPYKVEIGAIAQELQQIPQLAQAVSVNPVPPDQEERFPNGVPMSVYYDQLFSYNIRATQELHALVKSLQARIEVLEGQ